MKKKKLVIIIGNSRAGKSTIIRALTGYGGHRRNRSGEIGRVLNLLRVYIIEDISFNPPSRLYVVPNSLQENYRVTIPSLERLLRFVQRDNLSRGIVMALQPRINGRVSLGQIFDLGELRNFTIYPFVLRPGRPLPNQHNNDVDDNELPESLRRLRPRALDARTFAYFNAEIIQNQTNIIG